jgi:Inhibitor of growth proteins N-terminal histone-binding/PHD-finger
MLIEEYISAIEDAPQCVQRALTRLKEMEYDAEEEKREVEREMDLLEEMIARSSKSVGGEAGTAEPHPFEEGLERALQKINSRYIKILDTDKKKVEVLTELLHSLEDKAHVFKEDSVLFRERVAKESMALKLNQFTEMLGMQMDEEVGPDEDNKMYCFCKRPFRGEMVACDNPECPAEWYHYACVGLRMPPKGKWLCPECSQVAVQ